MIDLNKRLYTDANFDISEGTSMQCIRSIRMCRSDNAIYEKDYVQY